MDSRVRWVCKVLHSGLGGMQVIHVEAGGKRERERASEFGFFFELYEDWQIIPNYWPYKRYKSNQP